MKPAVCLLLGALAAFGWTNSSLAASSPGAQAEAVPTQDAAMALLQAGKHKEALEAFEQIISSHPQDPAVALFEASTLALQLNKWQEAQPYIRRLVKLRPGSMQAWELQVQVDQASGDTTGQQDAMDRMYSAWRSALDPATRERVAFTRDRIFGPKRTLVTEQTLDPGGDEIVRWIFAPVDQLGHPTHYLIVRSDEATNERWRESGTVSYGTVVYHLDAVQILGNGQTRSTPYEFYLNEPDYDRVRKKVAAILAGEAKPLSGDADPFWTEEPAQP